MLDAPATGDNKIVHTCNQCGHENVNLEKDEDGDFVCQECGYVIEPPSDNQVVHTCTNCDHKNVNLEKDEDGDLVCQECGTVIEPTANDSITHACIHCGHENTNLERDEDGDLVCQECGHVIPEENAGKVRVGRICLPPYHEELNKKKVDKGLIVLPMFAFLVIVYG